MDSKRREEAIKELDKAIERLRAEIEQLTPVVGDPEDVVDEDGWLPRDRREHPGGRTDWIASARSAISRRSCQNRRTP